MTQQYNQPDSAPSSQNNGHVPLQTNSPNTDISVQQNTTNTQYTYPIPAFMNAVPQITADSAVVLQGLTCVFGHKYAVNNLNLMVKKGEFFGFLGPNGAGKSTTIKMIVGQVKPTAGAAFVNGIDVWKQPLESRSLLGVLPEKLNLYERLSGREFLRFVGTLYNLPKKEVINRTEELLEVLSLKDDADKMVVDYSVGMRKKIGLAGAIIHRPSILFLDEPFEGVDPISSRIIRNILNELTRNGATIFFSSHIMEIVEKLCTRVGIINQGVLVAEGTLDELRQRAGNTDNQGNASLEDVFFQVVGANVDKGSLSWLEQ